MGIWDSSSSSSSSSTLVLVLGVGFPWFPSCRNLIQVPYQQPSVLVREVDG